MVTAAVVSPAEAMALSGVLFGCEAYGTWKDVIEANPELMYEPVRTRFRSGKDFSGADYVAAWHKLDALRVAYQACPADSLDYAVMEKADRVAVVPCQIGWDDVGAWPAVARIWPGDADGNTVVEFQDVALELQVTPHVTPDNRINMEIKNMVKA